MARFPSAAAAVFGQRHLWALLIVLQAEHDALVC
jgi:hypothetical protein